MHSHDGACCRTDPCPLIITQTLANAVDCKWSRLFDGIVSRSDGIWVWAMLPDAKNYGNAILRPMEALEHVLFYTHLLGFAAVAGGLFAQLNTKKHPITGLIINGTRWQLVSGLALAGIAHEDYRPVALGLKLGIIIVLLGIFESKRKHGLSQSLYTAMVATVLLQTAVALFVALD